MQCPRCKSDNPEVAQFCFKCGTALLMRDASASGRDHSFAVRPAELVSQFALISTIMPHTNRQNADHYRWSLIITAAAVIVFNLAGILPAAILAGAFLVPVAYLVYMYDAEVWQDSTMSVVLTLFVATGLAAALVSIVFFRW